MSQDKPIENIVKPETEDASTDLGRPGADLGTHAGTGADSGGTGAGTTALDAVGTQAKSPVNVHNHLKERSGKH